MKKKWKETQYRAAAATGLVVLVLLACSIAGTGRIDRYVAHSREESINNSLEESWQQEVEASEEASAEASAAEETAVHEMEITNREGQLLSFLEEKMESGDLAGAAQVLNENTEVFQALFYDRLELGNWIWDGSRVADRAEGRGMVFVRPTTVFYGELLDGVPEGACTALQAVNLEEGKRYDYSSGTWKRGRMAGPGECGYDYYEGVTGDSAKTVVKRGSFEDDLMSGTVFYSSTNMEGNTTSWTMEAAAGVIVPDDRWKQTAGIDGSLIWQLMADNDDGHAYTVEDEDMGQVRWKNMIEW